MSEGLDKVLAKVEPGHGYVEASASASTLTGPLVRLESGYRPLAWLGLFGFGQWSPKEALAGVGARADF